MQTKTNLRLSYALETLFILAGLWLVSGVIRKYLPNSALIEPMAVTVSALLIAACFFPAQARKTAEFCFRYRWALALLVFCACVCLRLHGSSIGVYDEVFPTQNVAEESTLFGIPRWIRSDEHGVTTPTYFSQAANGYQLYSRQKSLSPTNMVLDYFSPVWDLTILGKPLSWGFLLFGNEIGLSWYWCGMELLLFMTALEACLILTSGKRRESLLGAVLAALSPAVQWWVMPHMPIVLLYAMGLFCIGYRFFTAEGKILKGCFAALAMMAAVGFALSIFPSFQVPCAYAVLILLAACLWRDRENVRFTRWDGLWIALSAGGALVILGRFLLSSREELNLLLNTVYPGRRMSLGGNWRIADLFPNFSSLFLPYKDITYANNCEVSTAIHFAPFFLLLCPRLFARMKKEGDRGVIVGQAFFWILLAMALYMVIGIPRFLAEVTFLRFCNRMNGVYNWAAVLFTAWGFAKLKKYPDLLTKREKILWPVGYVLFSLLLVNDELRSYFSQILPIEADIGWLFPLAGALAFLTLLLLALFGKKRLLCAFLTLMMFFCGGTVNPIERGIGAMTNHPISSAIAQIAQSEPDSRWLCTEVAFFLDNFPMANGAKVLDATNFYPDTEKWRILDPENRYTEMTNRYANEDAVLTDGETSVELKWADNIKLNLNPESLKALDIRYLFTTADHTELLARYGITCEYVAGQDGYHIYRLIY